MRKRKAAGTHSSGPFSASLKLRRASSRGAPQAGPPDVSQSRASSSAAPQADDSLMEAIRNLGRVPAENRMAPKDEQKLARRLRQARREGKLSAEEEQELFALSKRQPVEAATSGASPPAAAAKAEDSLMEAIRTLGRMPKETKTAPKDEQKLARRLREARRQGKLSAENEKELSAFSERQAVEAESSDASQPAAAGMPCGTSPA